MVGNASRSTARRLDTISSERGSALRVGVRSVRLLAIQHVVRLRLVSVGRSRLAPVLLRSLGSVSALRMDLGRFRPMGVANASLRTMGVLGGCMVLGAGTHL